MLVTLLATAALALPGPPVRAYELPLAEHATGRTTICLHEQAFHHFVNQTAVRNAEGFWLPNVHAILLDKWACDHILHPSREWWNVAWAVFVLGHEAAHARQQDLGVPFNEHQADCWALADFQRLKRRLGIKRKLTTAGLQINSSCFRAQKRQAVANFRQDPPTQRERSFPHDRRVPAGRRVV